MERGLIRSTKSEIGDIKQKKPDHTRSGSKLSLSHTSQIYYGTDVINNSFIFLTTKTVIGMVEESMSQHTMVKLIPKRKVPSLDDLKENEVIDLFMFAQKTTAILEEHTGRLCKQVINSGDVDYNPGNHCCINVVVTDKGKTISFSSETKLPDLNNSLDVSQTASHMSRHDKIELTNTMRKAIKDMYK